MDSRKWCRAPVGAGSLLVPGQLPSLRLPGGDALHRPLDQLSQKANSTRKYAWIEIAKLARAPGGTATTWLSALASADGRVYWKYLEAPPRALRPEATRQGDGNFRTGFTAPGVRSSGGEGSETESGDHAGDAARVSFQRSDALNLHFGGPRLPQLFAVPTAVAIGKPTAAGPILQVKAIAVDHGRPEVEAAPDLDYPVAGQHLRSAIDNFLALLFQGTN